MYIYHDFTNLKGPCQKRNTHRYSENEFDMSDIVTLCVFAEMHHLEIWPQTWRLSRPVEKRLWYDIVHMRNHIQT